jgi:hypothetical protein
MDRKLYPVLFLAVVVVPFIALVHGCSAWMQDRRVAEAVPDFECPDLVVDTTSASFTWGGRQSTGYSTLRMPAECRARLERIVSQPPFAAGELCMPNSRCWSLSVDRQRYSFEFSEDRVGFRYSSFAAD